MTGNRAAAVGLGAAMGAPALDDAGVAVALAGAGDVDEVAGLEGVSLDHRAQLQLGQNLVRRGIDIGESGIGNLLRFLLSGFQLRLSSLKLDIPPLRERPEDIPLYAEYFLRGLNESNPDAPKSMSPEFLEGLRAYDWPGNIRELQNSVARAYYSSAGSLLTSENLVLSLERQEADASGETPSLPDAGEGAIVAALTICNGDVDAAAERLGVSRATLYRRMKKYGIVPRLLKQRP